MISFEGKKGTVVLTVAEVEEIIRWYERELRKMDRPGTRYTEWHRQDYIATISNYRARLARLKQKKEKAE